jgi:hypothetical protein
LPVSIDHSPFAQGAGLLSQTVKDVRGISS